MFRWLRHRDGRQGFPAGFSIFTDKAVMPGNGGLSVSGCRRFGPRCRLKPSDGIFAAFFNIPP
ncbi:hypothetical protein, partial [Klebsiella pneumoniae]|uniref:hypothetical protein n=1 Tax=Klebsiella pneumoniae TaxID=573 RepID=UPI001CD92FCD